MTDTGVIVHFPHESDMQASIFSDVFAQIESKFSPKHSQTGFHDPDARIAAISTLDEGIDAARQFLCFLLTRRNALMPIFLLPPEILARVFHFLVALGPPLSGSRNLGWIRVTHVCRHWRQVALEDSSLWAKIWGNPTTANTRWISEMLARAKDSPLDIEFDDDAKSRSKALRMILPHLSHTCQLRIHGLFMRHSDIVREYFNREAPALEHFELKVSDDSFVALQVLDKNILFKGHAPRLRVLSLLRVAIPWSLIPRGQLTQLRITRRNEDAHSTGDLNQLIDLLVNCPSLEILALHLPDQPDYFPHSQTIHLPHLSRLRLIGSTSLIMNMLEMVKLPSLTTLHLNFDSFSKRTHSGSADLSLRIPVILAQFQCPAPVEFKSLIVDTGPISRSLHITASTFPFTLQNCQARNFEDDIVGNVELVLSIDWLYDPPTYLIQQAFKMLPISNLDFISMSATQILDMNWVELFGRCTNVTTMKALGRGTKSLVRAFTAPTVTNARSKSGKKQKHDNREHTVVQPASTGAYVHPVIFPNLHSLELTALNFYGEHDPLGITFDIFKRGLQQRMETSGTRLKLLRMNDCIISSKCLGDLHELVEDFYWEPEEDSTDSLDSDGSDSDDYSNSDSDPDDHSNSDSDSDSQ